MSTHKKTLENWALLGEELLISCDPWLRVLRQKVQLPDGTIVPDYHHIKMPHTTQVLLVDEQNRLLVVEQFKQGVGKVCLSLPGGAIDTNEDPLVAAQRELREETGFEADQWQALSEHVNHGSYGCGKETIFMARGQVAKVQEPVSGDLEEMDVFWIEQERVQHLVNKGQVDIMGVLCALLLYLNVTGSSFAP